MLAYVFWHWKRQDVASPDYEARQRGFHAALGAAPPAGFVGSLSFAVAGAPWLAGAGGYEDWYLVDDFAALGALNDAAVSASRVAPHDAAAAAAAGGAGGVYRLRQGTVLPVPGHAHWFGKPEGLSYRELFARLLPVVEDADGALWGRQMVLGPAPEFCLQTAEAVSLPSDLAALGVTLRRTWAAFGSTDI